MPNFGSLAFFVPFLLFFLHAPSMRTRGLKIPSVPGILFAVVAFTFSRDSQEKAPEKRYDRVLQTLPPLLNRKVYFPFPIWRYILIVICSYCRIDVYMYMRLYGNINSRLRRLLCRPYTDHTPFPVSSPWNGFSGLLWRAFSDNYAFSPD